MRTTGRQTGGVGGEEQGELSLHVCVNVTVSWKKAADTRSSAIPRPADCMIRAWGVEKMKSGWKVCVFVDMTNLKKERNSMYIKVWSSISSITVVIFTLTYTVHLVGDVLPDGKIVIPAVCSSLFLFKIFTLPESLREKHNYMHSLNANTNMTSAEMFFFNRITQLLTQNPTLGVHMSGVNFPLSVRWASTMSSYLSWVIN